jgi:hypothetical protein
MTRSLLSTACTLACLATVGSARASAPNFFARRDYSAATSGIAVADTNGDGVPDLIALGTGTITVLLGNGNGTFRAGPKSTVRTGDVFFPLALDLNGDGHADLIFAGQSSFAGYSGIGVCLGNGNGTFQPAVFYQAGADRFLWNVVLGDFNGDGIPDAVVSGESGIWLFTGKGGGVFNPGVLTPMSGPTGGVVAAADFNGDGKLDLAVTTQTGFVVLLGNGNGTFQPPQTYATPFTSRWIAVGDLNLDGHPDIVLAAYGPTSTPNYVLVYLGNGRGGFAAPTKAEISPGEEIAIGDVNGDHIPDLVGSAGYIALGNGNGTFKKPIYYPLPSSGIGASGVVLADLRRSGRTDLVFQNTSISVLLSLGKGKFEDGEWTAIQGGAGCGAAADFNRDGKPDLAVNTPTGVSILLGTGQALHPFKSGATLTLPNAGCVVTGDLNGDGIPDLLVPSNGTVVAYLGNGDGTFTQKSTTATPTGGFLAVGDFNHDGKLDFATSGNLLALGNGDGTFQAPVQIAPDLGNGVTNIAAGDLNGDGWTDLVLTYSYDSYIYVLLNNQHGGFTETKIDSVVNGFLTGPTQILLADLNRDGKLDIVAATDSGLAVVYMGDGKGGFTYLEQLVPGSASNTSSVIAVADVNNDGVPDLVMTQAGVGTVAIFLGKGNGTFAQPYYVGAGPAPGDILLENLHGQAPSCGFPDIVVPDVSGGVMVLINLTASTCPAS